MELVGVGLLALVLAAGAWLVIRLIGRGGRNEGSTHGGGLDERTTGVDGFDRP